MNLKTIFGYRDTFEADRHMALIRFRATGFDDSAASPEPSASAAEPAFPN
jgi:hypothetical protein